MASIRKSSSADLTMNDFISHPIWGFVEDDGDEVESVNYPGYLVWPKGGDALFVACQFTFEDKTQSPGVVFVRMADQSFYVLGFPSFDGSLFRFPVNSPLEGSIAVADLEANLGKSADLIFPVSFNTPYVFENGKRLVGEYFFSQADER